MPVMMRVRKNCASTSWPKDVMAGGNHHFLVTKRYTVMKVSATSRRASVAASVVEPAQAFLLRIASAPHTSVGARSSLNRLRRARVRYKLPLKNYIIYIRNQNSRWIPKKNWRDGKRASLARNFAGSNLGAEGGIRTLTPYGATPSRWCVCQFRHFRTRKVRDWIVTGSAAPGKRVSD